MAKKYEGAVSFANGFSYSSAVPMDDRSVVSTKSDLYEPTNWKKNGVYFAYQGMAVTVAETGDIYTLIASEINDTTIASASAWHSQGSAEASADWEEM